MDNDKCIPLSKEWRHNHFTTTIEQIHGNIAEKKNTHSPVKYFDNIMNRLVRVGRRVNDPFIDLTSKSHGEFLKFYLVFTTYIFIKTISISVTSLYWF